MPAPPQNSTPARIDLSAADWTLRASDNSDLAPPAAKHWIPAHVPGCVHTALMNAGVIPDPRVATNELDLLWIGATDWEYRCRFFLDPGRFRSPRLDLVLDGLDTVATIRLNDVHVGDAANMFHPHRLDVTHCAHAGENDLRIHFRAPLTFIRECEARLGPRPVNGDWDPFNFIRKPAYNFGWDWGPKAATCGIWESARLESWSTARIDAVRPLVSRNLDGTWLVEVHANIQSEDQPAGAASIRSTLRLHASVEDPDLPDAPTLAQAVGAVDGAPIRLILQSPELWWPRSSGCPDHRKLYQLRLSLSLGVDSEPLDVLTRPLAFRSIRLDTTPGPRGTPFTLHVNDVPIFCSGVNWIPASLFPLRPSDPPASEKLVSLIPLGCNMVRVWGGGLYESEDFYNFCDRSGIMVWQDFMFSCAMYPEEPPYPNLIEAEARYQISRLSPHPSLVLWCGANECIWGYESWGWKQRLTPDQTWGNRYYLDLLPRLMQELDPSRPYWPNSPWSGSTSIHPNDADNGDRHTWEVRVDGYRTVTSRFCSEFGHQAPANFATLANAVPPADLQINSPGLQHRQRGPGGNTRQYDEPLAEWFRPPRSFDEWLYLAQLLQARAMRIGVEWCRLNQPRCMGALIWQLNDVWPGLTWSLFDSDDRPKLAANALIGVMHGRTLALAPRDSDVYLFAINNTSAVWTPRPRIRRVEVTGRVRADRNDALARVYPGEVQQIGPVHALVGRSSDPRTEFIIADARGCRRTVFFPAHDREVTFPQPRFTVLSSLAEGQIKLSILAQSLLHDLSVFPDRLDPSWQTLDPQPLTLLPGESMDITIHAPGPISTAQHAALDPNRLAGPPFLWCANLFGAGT